MSGKEQEKIAAIVVAAGVGSRMGDGSPKQYRLIDGKRMLDHSVEALLSEPRISKVTIVISPSDLIGQKLKYDDPRVTVARVGGLTRASSVQNGLSFSTFTANQWVLVHDAARPCLLTSDVSKLIDSCIAANRGGLLAVHVNDTLKLQGENDCAEKTVDRERLWAAQTPQMFRAFDLADALEKASGAVTDEAGAMEQTGIKPLLVEGTPTNIKVTRPMDLWLAEAIFAKRKMR